MTNFKIGDKVRILDVDSIKFGNEYWSNGDITEVIGFSAGDADYPILKRIKTDHSSWYNHITPDEYQYVEVVIEKQTKKQRIEALESQVEKQAEQIAILQYTIEKLREALL